MDNIRFLLVLLFAMISFMLYQEWDKDYGPDRDKYFTAEQIAERLDDGVPETVLTETLSTDDVPKAVFTEDGSLIVQDSGQEVSAIAESVVSNSNIITITTDVFYLEIDTKGGTISHLDLLKYPKSSAQANEGWMKLINDNFEVTWLPKTEDVDEDELIRLFNSDRKKLFLAQSGLIGNNSSAPNHHAVFSATQDSYQLQPDQMTLRVPLTWTNDAGIDVTKTFIFSRDSYLIKLEHQISNNSSKEWSGRQYSQLLRVPFEDTEKKTFIRTYTGGVLYTEAEHYEKFDYDDMDDMAEDKADLKVKAKGGWTAMIQHYFASSWVPPQDQENNFYTKVVKKSDRESHYVIGSYSPLQSVQPFGQHTFKSELFTGPKLQPVMEKIAQGLELTVDYGFLTFIGKPIFWLLNKLYSFFGNWGLAILGVTVIIKACFFPLSNASYRSMAKMRKVQPRLAALKEQHGDDKQAFNTEMMAMYKKEKVNPLGGCFPILIQIPVFISLYWVLIETVELRQAPFALWIIDLSVQDPYFVLPVLMGITMKLQQMLNPPPLDPIQAKVIKMFPIIFTVFFLFFPSGLVLYWVCNNTLSFLQQWYITNNIEREDAAKTA